MAEERDVNPVRRNGSGRLGAPAWTDLNDRPDFTEEELARILAKVIEQWLGDEDHPLLH